MELSTATKPRNHGRRLGVARPSGDIRHSALARLYDRRSAVDHLIRALERYQEEQRGQRERTDASTAGERS